MWILSDIEAKELVKTVRGLDAWCYGKRYTDPKEPNFWLLVYAEGLKAGMARVLETIGVSLKDVTKSG